MIWLWNSVVPYSQLISDISEIICQLRKFAIRMNGVFLIVKTIFNRTASLTDLQHLTVDQALADIAVFVRTAREHVSSVGGKVRLNNIIFERLTFEISSLL